MIRVVSLRGEAEEVEVEVVVIGDGGGGIGHQFAPGNLVVANREMDPTRLDNKDRNDERGKRERKKKERKKGRKKGKTCRHNLESQNGEEKKKNK